MKDFFVFGGFCMRFIGLVKEVMRVISWDLLIEMVLVGVLRFIVFLLVRCLLFLISWVIKGCSLGGMLKLDVVMSVGLISRFMRGMLVDCWRFNRMGL